MSIGEHIQYVICTDEDMKKSPAQRAYAPEEVVKGNLQIDLDYYLKNQLHPAIARICDPIEGTDSAMIAECLGTHIIFCISEFFFPFLGFHFFFFFLNLRCAFRDFLHEANLPF